MHYTNGIDCLINTNKFELTKGTMLKYIHWAFVTFTIGYSNTIVFIINDITYHYFNTLLQINFINLNSVQNTNIMLFSSMLMSYGGM